MEDCPNSSIRYWRYIALVLRRGFGDIVWIRDILVGGCIAGAGLGLQVFWKLISREDWHLHKWQWIGTVVLPICAVVILDIAKKLLLAPWQLHSRFASKHARDLQQSRDNSESLQAELDKLRDPACKFEANHSSIKQQVGPNQYAFHRRIGITNNSVAVARDCEFALVSCSMSIPGLTPDSALQVKDSPTGARKTDINRGDTKHFDLFVTFLTPETEWPQTTVVWTPNRPEIPRFGKAKHQIVFRLTGSNFSPRLWKGTVLLGEGDAENKNVEPT